MAIPQLHQGKGPDYTVCPRNPIAFLTALGDVPAARASNSPAALVDFWNQEVAKFPVFCTLIWIHYSPNLSSHQAQLLN